MVELYILLSSLILYVAMWGHKTHTTMACENFFIYKDIVYTKHYVYRIIYKTTPLQSRKNMHTKKMRYLRS